MTRTASRRAPRAGAAALPFAPTFRPAAGSIRGISREGAGNRAEGLVAVPMTGRAATRTRSRMLRKTLVHGAIIDSTGNG